MASNDTYRLEYTLTMLRQGLLAADGPKDEWTLRVLIEAVRLAGSIEHNQSYPKKPHTHLGISAWGYVRTLSLEAVWEMYDLALRMIPWPHGAVYAAGPREALLEFSDGTALPLGPLGQLC